MQSYPASVIEKYLNGELSAPEMHAIERAALDDPFLADALEGMALHRQLPPGQKSFREDMGELQNRLEKRVAEKVPKTSPILPFFRMSWRAAAAVILLLGLGVTAYYTLFNKAAGPAPALARSAAPQTHAPAPISSTAADSFKASPPPANTAKDSISLGYSSSANASGTLQKPKIVIRPDALVRTDQAPPANNSIIPPAQAEASTVARTDDTRAKTDREIFLKKGIETSSYKTFEKNKVVSFSTFDSSLALRSLGSQSSRDLRYDSFGIPNQLVFTGKVTDRYNNKALAGASLFMNGHNDITAVTDKNGNFSVRLPRSDTNNRLTVVHTGYEEASLALNQSNIHMTSNIIQLQPQATSLNEVVISGYGAKRKEVLRRNIDTPPKEASRVALPVDGWPAYNSYLETGKKTSGLDSTLAGVETISFIVNQKGALSSFKVDRSISPAHDSASIRLIRQGPSWKLMKGRSERAVVNIIFP